MKKIMPLLAVVAILSSSAQANWFDDLFGTRLSRKADRLARKLEANPFELRANKHDQCAVDQLRVFLKDWRHSSKFDRAYYISAMKRISSTTVNASSESGVLTGERYVLILADCSGFKGSCHYYQKDIGEKFTLNGRKARSVFDKSSAGNVFISTEYVADKHVTFVFKTYRRHLFNQVDSVDSAEFKEALDKGIIFAAGRHDSDKQICGTRPLQEFIDSISIKAE